MKFALLLLLTINIAHRPRIHHVDLLECNHLPSGSTQLIVWEVRPRNYWPQDWTMQPCGHFDGERWYDANGAIVWPVETIESWTDHDPERRAYNWWQAQKSGDMQGGIWH